MKDFFGIWYLVNYLVKFLSSFASNFADFDPPRLIPIFCSGSLSESIKETPLPSPLIPFFAFVFIFTILGIISSEFVTLEPEGTDIDCCEIELAPVVAEYQQRLP